ncbi:uncharacterized protein NECHADRAFT_82981 [Fusarium vanettenii 77-13-4]|uniref:Uncharacterized protein n=1 Tax=Fusarium vanettenii (strain ATCC MYA-4622 / CBS 123669 / FGSC 9596 / NRRL 45880 / 77-13-4) TaxID=660122 RepID=C7ZAU0_FUSV7|nr:uncharacterized protein NECHADRAFT_82981 [Fusarium vanettenii 77-13-4]EEU38632.1 predicted protein [Fusarium vanettenii 77-13-4]
MLSPVQTIVLSGGDWEGYELRVSGDPTLERINEMLGLRTANDANDSISTNTNTNDMDLDSAKGMNRAADSEEKAEVVLTMIDGKLHYWERSGHIRPVKATPEELKQWVRDECRDTRKKDEWIKWLMEAPLDPNQFGGASMTPHSDIESPEGLKSAVHQSLDDLNNMYCDMQCFKVERNMKLDEALQLDFNYRSAKKDVEWYTMVIGKSLEKDGES